MHSQFLHSQHEDEAILSNLAGSAGFNIFGATATTTTTTTTLYFTP